MARGFISITQVPAALRSKRASKARQQIREALESPTLVEKQRVQLLDQLKWVSKWERGEVVGTAAPRVEVVYPKAEAQPFEEAQWELPVTTPAPEKPAPSRTKKSRRS